MLAKRFTIRQVKSLAVVSAAAVLLGGCSGQQGATGAQPSNAPANTIEVQDNHGTQTVPAPPQSVVSTDNRTFETLAEWNVDLAAAPKGLIPDTIPYATDESVVDLGTHNEPNLEAVVAAQPDLVINGQRFVRYREDFERLVPDAAVVELEPRDGQPLDAELKRQVTVLGEIFGQQGAAQGLSTNLDQAIARAEGAYDPAQTVMAVNVSGGDIGYLAPRVGRTLGPVFPILGLTPALEVPEASDDHQGDDISVEAIAQSNPDWILVLDRDAAVSDDPNRTPAQQVIEGSQALQGVTAVREGNVVYMPPDTYTNEGIQTYTEFFTAFADELERAR